MAHQAVRKAEVSDWRIARLATAAERIGSVVRLIAAIAQQTNLLALNPTIEAARVGKWAEPSHCSQEVKCLASQTTQATAEIGDQIGAIQAATSDRYERIVRSASSSLASPRSPRLPSPQLEDQNATGQSIALNLQEAVAKASR